MLRTDALKYVKTVDVSFASQPALCCPDTDTHTLMMALSLQVLADAIPEAFLSDQDLHTS